MMIAWRPSNAAGVLLAVAIVAFSAAAADMMDESGEMADGFYYSGGGGALDGPAPTAYWEGVGAADPAEEEKRNRFFALRGRRGGVNHLLRGKKAMDHLLRGKKAQMEHLLRGGRAMDHLLRGKKFFDPSAAAETKRGEMATHLLRGRRDVGFHRIMRDDQFNHLMRGKREAPAPAAAPAEDDGPEYIYVTGIYRK